MPSSAHRMICNGKRVVTGVSCVQTEVFCAEKTAVFMCDFVNKGIMS